MAVPTKQDPDEVLTARTMEHFKVGRRYRNVHDSSRVYLACRGGPGRPPILYVVEGPDQGHPFNMDRFDLFNDFVEVP